ncbi:hypothetical protein CRV00_12020 [Malaciobacter molluscorum]|uniref:hypothetical protein n=1 Tax=Malaciobacter molluscorum TaxID=1032072 RepID=UPI00100C0255|nr:hypothetical protein [Malaciobacter molluscorum]RXJ92867.1 hypothetical protein CRV00_12020 [Malaciobacter molluscorum]
MREKLPKIIIDMNSSSVTDMDSYIKQIEDAIWQIEHNMRNTEEAMKKVYGASKKVSEDESKSQDKKDNELDDLGMAILAYKSALGRQRKQKAKVEQYKAYCKINSKLLSKCFITAQILNYILKIELGYKTSISKNFYSSHFSYNPIGMDKNELNCRQYEATIDFICSDEYQNKKKLPKPSN